MDPGATLLQLVRTSQEMNASAVSEVVHSLPAFRNAPVTTTATVTPMVTRQTVHYGRPAFTPRAYTRRTVTREQAEAAADRMTEAENQLDRELALTRTRQGVGRKRDKQASTETDTPESTETDTPKYLWKTVPASWKGQLWRPYGQGLAAAGPPRLAVVVPDMSAAQESSVALRVFVQFCLSGRMRAMVAEDATPLMPLSVLYRLVQYVNQYESARGHTPPDVQLLQAAQNVAFRFYSLLLQFVDSSPQMAASGHHFETPRTSSLDYIAHARSILFSDGFASGAMRDFASFATHAIPELHFHGSMRMVRDLQWWHAQLQLEMARYASNSFPEHDTETKNTDICCIVHMLFIASMHPSVHVAAAAAVSATLWNTRAPSSASHTIARPVPSGAPRPSLTASVTAPSSPTTSVNVPFSDASAASSPGPQL